MAEIVLERVSKRYPGGAAAVRDVSLRCPNGAFVVLVGPSGCGKSTTLRMVAGLEAISEGTISIDGRVVNDVEPKDRDIAMVFQNYALYPHMSVYQNMAFALKLRKVGREEIDRRVRDAAKMLGLEQLLERKPAALSGGQRQRVAVARAMVREPKAFLFDEPLSNLDAKLRVSTRSELKALHQRLKTTTIYVTHDQEEAMTLGDIVVVMSNGLVQQVGPPLEVYSHPVNRFVAGFLGSPAMNFIEGTVRSNGGGASSRLVFEEGSAMGSSTQHSRGTSPAALELPERLHAAARSYVDKPLVLGVRPHAMRLAHAPDGRLSISVTVRVVEPLGDQMDVTCETAQGTRLVARVDADGAYKPGHAAALNLDPARIHLFEPGEFGRNLGEPA
jgi:multiple sugar transport system ATP-binding protein